MVALATLTAMFPWVQGPWRHMSLVVVVSLVLVQT
jgi:hypothetical protein